MLCKVNISDYLATDTVLYSISSITVWLHSNKYDNVVNYPLKYNSAIPLKVTTTISPYVYRNILVLNGTTVATTTGGGPDTTKNVTSSSTNCTGAIILDAKDEGASSGTSGTAITFTNLNFIVTSNTRAYFTRKDFSNDITGYPIDIRAIGKQARFIFYGVHNNTEYIGGLMLEKDTTATTGSIALWNAKWYIKVNFNGEIIKIPYYWD